jgi:HEAT repeat protein
MDDDQEQGGELFRSLLGQDETPKVEGPGAPEVPPPPSGSAIDLAADEAADTQERELAATLRSGSTRKRKTALRVLLDRPITARLAAAAATALSDPNLSLRTLVLDVLDRVPHLAPEGVLEQAATQDSDTSIRARALAALGRSRRASALLAIEESLETETDGDVVDAALTALGQVLQTSQRPFPPSSLRGVCAAVGAVSAMARVRHNEELGLIARVIREDDLMALLDDPAPGVRAGAAVLSMVRASRNVWEVLARRTEDPERGVRDLAVDAALRLQRGKAPPREPEAGFDVDRFGRRFSDATRPVEVQTPVREPSRPDEPPPSPPPDDESIATLLGDLGAEDTDVQARAREALEEIAAEHLEAWAERYLETNDPRRAVDIANLIESLGRVELVPHLCTVLSELPEGSEQDEVAAKLRPLDETWSVVETLQREDDAERRVKAVHLATLVDPARQEPFEVAIADHSSSVRLAAISSGEGPPTETVGRLLTEVISKDTSLRVRVAAVGRFWDSDPHRRVGVAEHALRSQDPAVRMAAVELLVDGTDQEMGLLARALRDDDTEVAGRAITYLASVRSSQALALLWSSLRQVPPEVGERIMTALEGFDRDTVIFLGRQSLDSDEPEDRAMGLRVLSRYDTAIEQLIAALEDPSPEVRKEALRNLMRRPDPQAVHAVGARLRDPDPEVRLMALHVLPKTDDDRVLLFFVDGAKDPAPEVRDFARDAVLAHSPDAVAPVLIKSLTFPSHRRAAADLLAEMGAPAVGHLTRALGDSDPEVRLTIGQILASAEAGPRLTRQLSHRDPEMRLLAVEGLGAVGSTQEVPALVERLHDPDGRVRARAATVLGELGDPAAIEPLKQAFVSDPDMDVVGAIEPALRRLTGEDPEHD